MIRKILVFVGVPVVLAVICSDEKMNPRITSLAQKLMVSCFSSEDISLQKDLLEQGRDVFDQASLNVVVDKLSIVPSFKQLNALGKLIVQKACKQFNKEISSLFGLETVQKEDKRSSPKLQSRSPRLNQTLDDKSKLTSSSFKEDRVLTNTSNLDAEPEIESIKSAPSLVRDTFITKVSQSFLLERMNEALIVLEKEKRRSQMQREAALKKTIEPEEPANHKKAVAKQRKNFKQLTLPNKRGASVGDTSTQNRNQQKNDESVQVKPQISPKYKPSSSENQTGSVAFKYEDHSNNFQKDESLESYQQRGLSFTNAYLDSRKFPSLSRVQNNPVRFGQKKQTLLEDFDRARLRVLIYSPSHKESERHDKLDYSISSLPKIGAGRQPQLNSSLLRLQGTHSPSPIHRFAKIPTNSTASSESRPISPKLRLEYKNIKVTNKKE